MPRSGPEIMQWGMPLSNGKKSIQSFSSAVKDCEERVLIISEEVGSHSSMVTPSAVRSMPISTNCRPTIVFVGAPLPA